MTMTFLFSFFNLLLPSCTFAPSSSSRDYNRTDSFCFYKIFFLPRVPSLLSEHASSGIIYKRCATFSYPSTRMRFCLVYKKDISINKFHHADRSKTRTQNALGSWAASSVRRRLVIFERRLEEKGANTWKLPSRGSNHHETGKLHHGL